MKKMKKCLNMEINNICVMMVPLQKPNRTGFHSNTTISITVKPFPPSKFEF